MLGGDDSSAGVRRSRAVHGLAIACVVVFLVQLMADSQSGDEFTRLFGLSRARFLHGALWQVVTYIFLHGGLWHIFMNLLMLFVFGRELEELFGTRRFLLLFFGSGVLAGIGWMLVSGGGFGVCIGASGAVFGVMGAFAALFPERRITLLLFFVIPITMTTRTLALVMGGVALFSLLGDVGGVAHMAHIAGGVAGYVYGRRLRPLGVHLGVSIAGRPVRVSNPFRNWGARRRRSKFTVVRGADEGVQQPTHEEVNRILEKLLTDGLAGLTSREREILERASRRPRRGSPRAP